jgi:hypothetical protein
MKLFILETYRPINTEVVPTLVLCCISVCVVFLLDAFKEEEKEKTEQTITLV